ncbi:MAG: rod shape-determining protein MreD [Actinobacteria bacterium]|nr:rod shape-determining protein MreD [Actinomycetota bacterium]
MFERLLRAIASRWFRLVLVVLVVLSIQTTLFSEIRPFGYAVQIVAVFVACVGCTHDIQTGAVVGLISGFMYDAVLATPLGVSAIVFGALGALAALLMQPFREPTWWLRLLAVSVVAGFGEVLMPVMKSVVGLSGWLDARIIGASLVTFVAALIVASPLIPVSRWTLRERLGRDA